MTRFKFNENFCLNLNTALNCEWLESNGTGSYASSSILNCNTRKYHGLLVANLREPEGRHVLLSWLEDSISLEGEMFFLSCCRYPGLFFPQEKHHLKEFRLENSPQFIYKTENFRIHKEIFMVHGEDRILVRYEVEQCPSSAVLNIKPFLAYRDYHSLSKQNSFIRPETCVIENGFKMQPYDGMPFLFMHTDVKSRFSHSPVWYNNFEYKREQERGFEWKEDLFCPGIFEIPVKKGGTVIVSASLSATQEKLEDTWIKETKRRAREMSKNTAIAKKFYSKEDKAHVRNLIAAGRQFLITSPSGRPAILAGYHWFVDWGRDTLISLPGLTFLSGRNREGTDILISFSEHENNGLLPNYFSDDKTKHAYNTVDTSLWYFWAVQQMLKYTGNSNIIEKRLWPAMKNILRRYMEGTSFNIHMSENGLLHAGDKDTQLTWMDATAEGRPVTPRWGYPVEINALWYNAVCFANELAQRFNDPDYLFPDLIPRIKKSFVDAFWIASESYCGDVLCDGFLHHAIRPNQILAVSLPHSPLEPAQWKGVVEKVRELLLTPVGLRTLSREDKNYRGRYEGDGPARDAAYHQGTVWPWPIGHFGEAYLKVADNKAAAKIFLLNLIRTFLDRHLAEAGVGSISEIFDGDPPQYPKGCISQAWSVAELIRLYALLNETDDA